MNLVWGDLDRLHHALPQEPDPGASIALALEQLQAVDHGPRPGHCSRAG